MLLKFDLAALKDLDDGRVAAGFDQALQRCVADCKDRPNLKDARTINLKVTIVPVAGDDAGEMESCDVQFKITDAIPKRSSKVYNAKSTRNGLVYNDLSPDEVNQMTLDQAPSLRSTTHVG